MADFSELEAKLSGLKSSVENQIGELKDSKGVYELKKALMDGKTGAIGSLMRDMGKIAAEQRSEYGKKVNELKKWAEDRFTTLQEEFKKKEMLLRYELEKIDVTAPANEKAKANLHPVTLVTNELIDIFAGMGFEVFEGSEIETDHYNFTALNTPKDHPARDMQDTFYLTDRFLLRTQTSAGQIHVMEAKKPPIKIISPGKVFRSDDDATHSPMFT